VRYYLTDLFVDDPTDSEVRAHVFFALKRANIPFSMPAHALFVTKENERRKQRKVEEALADRIEVVRKVDLFKTLTPEEVQEVALRLQPAPFIQGDVMTRQGAQAHWLYIIVSGQADVVVERPDGATAKINEMGPGSFFGEMGLLTGAPRSATVIARSPVDCYRLDKEAFREVLLTRPALAEELSGIMQVRMREQTEAIKQLETHASTAPAGPLDLIAAIRAFFNL
jgi:CRP-like cAMP-binding protein